MSKTKDLRFVLDLYKGKDERSETYYLTVIGKEKDGSEVLLLSHLNNKAATGYQMLKNLTNRAKKQFSKLIIEEYRTFSNGSSGAIDPVQVHDVSLQQNKPAIMENSVLELFGGLEGFGALSRQQGQQTARLQYLEEKIEDLKEEKAALLAKVGNHEAHQKQLEKKIIDLQDEMRKMKWKHDDIVRDLKVKHDDELRKYKGQSALVQAGVQGLGGLLVKKLNISDADLQGLLGFDVPQQTQQTQSGGLKDVEIKPETELSPEQQYIKQRADQIHDWIMNTNKAVADKVYAVFQSLASDEENLDAFYSMALPEEQTEI
jgi:hypothetical protein